MNTQLDLKSKLLTSEDEEFNNLIIDSIQDIKGNNLLKLDLRKLEDTPSDFFIICDGESIVQVKAIANNVQKRVKEMFGINPFNSEGVQAGNWVCLDYLTTVVHVFYHETRDFYELEDLWSDAVITEYQAL